MFVKLVERRRRVPWPEWIVDQTSFLRRIVILGPQAALTLEEYPVSVEVDRSRRKTALLHCPPAGIPLRADYEESTISIFEGFIMICYQMLVFTLLSCVVLLVVVNGISHLHCWN